MQRNRLNEHDWLQEQRDRAMEDAEQRAMDAARHGTAPPPTFRRTLVAKVCEQLQPMSAEEFHALPQNKRAVRLATEVLCLMKKDFLAPGHCYISLQANGGHIGPYTLMARLSDVDKPVNEEEAQLHVVLGAAEKCEACAIGALAYTSILAFNDLTFQDYRELNEGSGDLSDGTGLVRVLKKYGFDEYNLCLMEAAYENSLTHQLQTQGYVRSENNFDAWCSSDEDDYSNFEAKPAKLANEIFAAVTWGMDRWHREESLDDRQARADLLAAIMENIIRNDGVFDPFQEYRDPFQEESCPTPSPSS